MGVVVKLSGPQDPKASLAALAALVEEDMAHVNRIILDRARSNVDLIPELARHLDWLPKTCAYRLVAEGQDLPWWHPLKTKDQNSPLRAGGTVFGKVVSETEVDDNDLEDMVVSWFD